LNERYSRRLRLRKAEIVGLLAVGRLFKCPGMNVMVKANTLGTPRLGLIVPKRILRRAVDRNRAKRVLRDWFRRHKEQIGSRDLLIRLTGAEVLVGDVADKLARLA
jgi:ribonuclease P protein component